MKKPKKPPISGVWRIVQYRRTDQADPTSPWERQMRWLFDEDTSYKRYLNRQVNQALRLSEPSEYAPWNHPWYKFDDVERFVVEEYLPTGWCQIDEWIGPNAEQRILKGLRP